jgi:hypothetical protein
VKENEYYFHSTNDSSDNVTARHFSTFFKLSISAQSFFVRIVTLMNKKEGKNKRKGKKSE